MFSLFSKQLIVVKRVVSSAYIRNLNILHVPVSAVMLAYYRENISTTTKGEYVDFDERIIHSETSVLSAPMRLSKNDLNEEVNILTGLELKFFEQ